MQNPPPKKMGLTSQAQATDTLPPAAGGAGAAGPCAVQAHPGAVGVVVAEEAVVVAVRRGVELACSPQFDHSTSPQFGHSTSLNLPQHSPQSGANTAARAPGNTERRDVDRRLRHGGSGVWKKRGRENRNKVMSKLLQRNKMLTKPLYTSAGSTPAPRSGPRGWGGPAGLKTGIGHTKKRSVGRQKDRIGRSNQHPDQHGHTPPRSPGRVHHTAARGGGMTLRNAVTAGPSIMSKFF